MRDRVILHCDINHCYAQIEEMRFPGLRYVPMAVGGDEERRHGIILAKNDLAKMHRVKTGESLHEALEKCPELLILPPSYEEYLYYSDQVKEIYKDYSDKIESYGLDEAWIDVTDSYSLFGSGHEIASVIRKRVFCELGLTISIGISFNKVFAKFASDLIKPYGLVEINRENFKEEIWPLPVENLLYVGNATRAKLNFFGIETIGDLAKYDVKFLQKKLGKMGSILWRFANGLDVSTVELVNQRQTIKSIGNSVTTVKDVADIQDAKIVLNVLSESVASRLKDNGLKGKTITLCLRDTQLDSFTRRCKINPATDISEEILNAAMKLLRENTRFEIPFRSLGVSVSDLEANNAFTQPDLFTDYEKRSKQKRLDEIVDQIRERYGYYTIRKCSMLIDEELSGFDPKREHTIHPVGYF